MKRPSIRTRLAVHYLRKLAPRQEARLKDLEHRLSDLEFVERTRGGVAVKQLDAKRARDSQLRRAERTREALAKADEKGI